MKNELVKLIKELNTNQEYDCLLMYSGGKDSSYLLYYMSEILHMNVLTVTLKHDFLPVETIENIENFTQKFSKKHIYVQNAVLNQSGKHFLENWINKPDGGSLITLCTGCRLGLIKQIVETAKSENINVVISGNTPYEDTDDKINLVNYPAGKKGKIYFFLGYMRLLLRNPSLLKNIKAFFHQAEEFYYYKNKNKVYDKNEINFIDPFYEHITYDESKIIKKLKELNWKRAGSTSNSSYWRSDCNMYAIRHYFYNQVAGYNEGEKYYTKLYDEKIISQEYMEEGINRQYEKAEIMDLLTSLELSQSSLDKYKDFLGKFANNNIPYPSCGSCKGLGR
jgi:tRNA(Ile)-lysidine synthase TilS/MesJ